MKFRGWINENDDETANFYFGTTKKIEKLALEARYCHTDHQFQGTKVLSIFSDL
jgi:hypothetical protein